VIEPSRNILLSFHYYSRVDLDRMAGTRIACDSGAISVRRLGKVIETKQLVAWAKVWHHRIAWMACLDVMSNPVATQRNWNEMVDAGVPGIPTLHLREHPSEMDYYVERGVDFIGLGGTALVDATPTKEDKLKWLVACFKYARENHPQVRFHGWGLANNYLLRLPWFSVDSSGWGASYRYGRLQLRDPTKRGKSHGILLNGRGTYSQEIATLLRDHYGVNPSEVSTSVPDNRLLMVRMSALSAAVLEKEVQWNHRKNPITPPTWGRLGGWDLPDLPDLHGPVIHLVDGHPAHIETVARLARGETFLWNSYAQ
jgi:hypothetical protein